MKIWRWGVWTLLAAVLLAACGDKPAEQPDVPVPEEELEQQIPEEPGEEDGLLHAVDVELGGGVSGRLELYGKALNEYNWGVRCVTWTPEGADEPSCAFTAREAIEAENDAIGLETGESDWDNYTEAWEQDGGLVLADFNFDGYLDVALQAMVPAYNWPHYYWLYHPETGKFEYAFHHVGLTEVLPDQELLVCDYHSTPEYYTTYWGYDENGELGLVHRNTLTYGDFMTSANEYHGSAVTQLTAEELADFADYFNRPGYVELLRSEDAPPDMEVPSYDVTDGCRFRDGSILLYYHITGEMHYDRNFPMHALLKPGADGGWEILRVHPDGSY